MWPPLSEEALRSRKAYVSTFLSGEECPANDYTVIEMFLTAQLVITIFLLAAEKHKGTFLAPIGIGLSLFIAELSGVYFTGGKLSTDDIRCMT